MKDQLNRIEQRLQYLIETGLPALLPLGNARRTLVHEVVDAMQASLFAAADGLLYAPNGYTLVVNPERLADWQSDPNALAFVAHQLHEAASEAGIRFIHPPVFHLQTDPAVPLHDVKIVAYLSQEEVSDTAALVPQPPLPDLPDTMPQNAFLIVNGVDVFPLRQPVINIGRRLDNHLVIDDPRVSRTHAQLRAVHGQYILFDLNSTGGTYVNGQRVSRYNLNPGDVISLAGVALIFGQDTVLPSSGSDPAGDMRLPPGSTQTLHKPSDPSSDTHHL
jgi:hypothetical protein